MFMNFDDIVDLIGDDAAKKFLQKFGGTEVSIPPRINSKSRFNAEVREAIGDECANKLISIAAGTQFYVPNLGQKNWVDHRNKMIVRMRKEGEKTESIAQRFGITERAVYMVLKKMA